MPNNALQRNGIHHGRCVLPMDCVLAGVEMHRGRPLNSVVRPHLGRPR
jgi:hypothetical protein